MKIVFTRHAEKKMKDLSELGILVTKSLAESILLQPAHLDEVTDFPRKIASGELDSNHVLRIIFREEHDIIVVITFYPAKKGRYF